MRNTVFSPIFADGLPLRWRIAGLLIALALGAWCYAPGLQAFFAQDDFAFLAFVRLLHQPWLLFTHNHFPDYAYFRPLGVLLWWLVAAIAADAAWPQYALNLVLHLGCVAALYTLLQRLRHDAPLNAAWAALYAAHPLAIGTALWLSDRFDLLATLFSLLAVSAALAYAAHARAATLFGLLGALLAALLGKELSVVGVAAAFAAIAIAPRARLDAKRRTIALAAITALTFAWLAWRHAMLTTSFGGGTHLPATAAFATGTWNWLRAGAVYLFADPRAQRWACVLVALAVVLWGAAALLARRETTASSPRLHVAAALLVLILLPGLVQAPVAARHLAAGIGSDLFFFNLIVPSRFFHLGLAGLICGLALITTPQRATARSPALRLSVTGILLALLALVPLSRQIAGDYAAGTDRQAAAFAAAEAALARAALPAHGCQVYFLHTSALWGFTGLSDSIAKGLAAQPERLAHCLVSTEQPAWTYFVRKGSVQADDYRPLHPLEVAGKPFPVLEIGDTEALYFTLGEDLRAAPPAGAIFLEYRDGAFVDVSAAVRSGELKPDFATSK
ncbi:MAG: hypothetical protein JSS42_13620 [Proteobacteria bacterium]|uniref:hypothetical protein n=1 Tax=Rudaea sp. TaxID=2136325 RepID=UPI0032204C14|nr:hypothetical protein [Pseudomonadota bacterium]